jgi:uncharacterized membrane protein YphA (DoxX/SURF4 family)
MIYAPPHIKAIPTTPKPRLSDGGGRTLTQNATMMAEHGMPAVPPLLGAAAVVEILDGLGLLVGFQTRIVALVLFLYLIPTTLIFHNFWAAAAPAQQEQMSNFLKNLAIMGGLLEFFAAGAAPRRSMRACPSGPGRRRSGRGWAANLTQLAEIVHSPTSTSAEDWTGMSRTLYGEA